MNTTQPQTTQAPVLSPLTFADNTIRGLGFQWYLGTGFNGHAEVTSNFNNPALGIDSIRLFASNNPERPQSVGTVQVSFLHGMVTAGGWINQSEDGDLMFNANSSEYIDSNGDKKYRNVNTFDIRVIAQILRYAHSRLQPLTQEVYQAHLARQQQRATNGLPAAQQPAVQQPAVYQQPAQPAAPAQQTVNTAASFSVEQPASPASSSITLDAHTQPDYDPFANA